MSRSLPLGSLSYWMWGLLLLRCSAPLLPAQQTKQPAPAVIEQEPPEEDPDLQPQEYSFNPLEAARNITAGNFYFKKGNYRAASRRYLEATKWDPTSGAALLKLAAAYEKLRNFDGARESYIKYLQTGPDAKDIAEIQKRLSRLPMPKPAPTTTSEKK